MTMSEVGRVSDGNSEGMHDQQTYVCFSFCHVDWSIFLIFKIIYVMVWGVFALITLMVLHRLLFLL